MRNKIIHMEIKNCSAILAMVSLLGCTPQNKTVSEKTPDAYGFFPVYNIYLGQTTVDELWYMGYKPEVDRHSYSCEVARYTNIRDYRKDRIFERLNIYYWGDNYDPTPPEWKEKFGFSKDLSYNGWLAALKKMRFEIEEKRSFNYMITALSPDKSLKLELEFKSKYEKKNGKDNTYDKTAPGSLDIMVMQIK